MQSANLNDKTNTTMYVVKIYDGVWLAKGTGDPSRTLIRSYARQFPTEKHARRALQAAIRKNPHRNFSEAVIEEVEVKLHVIREIKP